jgi:hypothetical protein
MRGIVDLSGIMGLKKLAAVLKIKSHCKPIFSMGRGGSLKEFLIRTLKNAQC